MGDMASKAMVDEVLVTDETLSVSFYMPEGGKFPDDVRVRILAPKPGSIAPLILEAPLSSIAIVSVKADDLVAALKECRAALVAGAGYA